MLLQCIRETTISGNTLVNQLSLKSGLTCNPKSEKCLATLESLVLELTGKNQIVQYFLLILDKKLYDCIRDDNYDQKRY